jgi:hypothetical protein
MTQQEFAAARFGFSVKTLRHREQGPPRAYLLVIDRAPDRERLAAYLARYQSLAEKVGG